jgi:hypothetical protein
LYYIVQGLAKAGRKNSKSICRRRRELFFIVTFHFSIGKSTMNAPRLWKMHKDYLTGIGAMFGGSKKGKGKLSSAFEKPTQVPPTDLVPPLTKAR